MPPPVRTVGASLVAVLLGGCWMTSDSPRHPSRGPVAIWANAPGVCESSGPKSLLAGQHDVFVVTAPGLRVRVIMVNAAGRTVFQKHKNWFHLRTVRLAPGRYLLQCLYADGTSGETALVVRHVPEPA
jgi:hypothetical protein